jgi:hypothetical protein
LVLTPVGIGLLTYGGYRYQRVVSAADYDPDMRGLAALAAGGLVLLIVATIGALSPAGPLLSGLVYGLAPAAVFLAIPEDVIGWVAGAPLVPAEIETVTLSWLVLGCFVAVGVTLVGPGFGTAMRRR